MEPEHGANELQKPVHQLLSPRRVDLLVQDEGSQNACFHSAQESGRQEDSRSEEADERGALHRRGLTQRKRTGEPGLIGGLFLLMYGVGRTIAERFREPDYFGDDAFIETLPEWLTMGQILSMPMWAGGLYLVWTALSRERVDVAKSA